MDAAKGTEAEFKCSVIPFATVLIAFIMFAFGEVLFNGIPPSFKISNESMEFLHDVLNASTLKYFQEIPHSLVIQNYTIFSNKQYNYHSPPLYMRKKNDSVVNPKGYVFGYQNSFGLTYNFYHMTNVFCGADCDIITHDSITYYSDYFGEVNSRHLRKIRGCLNHAIYLSAAGTDTYGDMIMGSFVRMVVIPREYFEISTLVVHKCSLMYMFNEVIELLQIPRCPIYGLEERSRDIVYCRNLYTVYPFKGLDPKRKQFVHLNFFGPIMRKFGTMILDSVNSTKKPYDYALYNRFKGMRRSFVNFDEMVATVSKAYPQHNFTTIIGHHNNLTAAIKRYGVIKWLFSVAGSNSMNCIFMRPRTMVCLYMASFFDSPAVGAILGSDVMLVSYMNEKQNWLGKPLTVDIERMMQFVNKSMEMLYEEDSKRLP